MPLPSWAVAVSIGGPVTLESILDAFVLGLQLAVILLCFGAANSLASPYRLLRSLPAVLYETGVAVTVALSFAPELVQSIGDRASGPAPARHSDQGAARHAGRGGPGAGERAGPLPPTGHQHGRPGLRAPDLRREGVPRLASGATVVGLLLMAVGIYGVIDGGSLLGLGLPVLAVAAVLCGVGLAVGGRRTARSRYRPDPWRAPEWIVAGSGLAALVAMAVAGALDVPGLTVSFSPLAFPSIPLLPVVGILIALVPAVARRTRRPATRHRRTGRPKRQSLAHGRRVAPEAGPTGPLGGLDMITFDQVSFTYTEAQRPTLHG